VAGVKREQRQADAGPGGSAETRGVRCAWFERMVIPNNSRTCSGSGEGGRFSTCGK
jgi:hypothetical protein